MADTGKKMNAMTNSSTNEVIRPVSYTGPLMPRPVNSAENPVAENQQKILIPDFMTYFQTLVDSIFQQTKEEPAQKLPEKTAAAEFSEKKNNEEQKRKKEYNNLLMKIRMESDPYNKLMYEQCVLESCSPEFCANKYFPDMA
jgi:hypothetical protein